MQKVMNLKIKFRESFRPFAPAVLRDRVSDYFGMRPGEDSPYMLLVAEVNQAHRRGNDRPLAELRGLEKLYAERSTVPAITHVDYSARVQTVDQERNPEFYHLLKAFEKRTGSPVLINTSFNVRGEPIVCTPEDAYRCFMGTNMDVLVVGEFVLRKEAQPGGGQTDNADYLKQFALD